jgi:hypothetical protein
MVGPRMPVHRQLLANPVAWIRRMAEKANSKADNRYGRRGAIRMVFCWYAQYH